MSLWRRKAIEMFPALGPEVAQAEDAHGVAFEIRLAVMENYQREPLDEAFLKSAYGYAWWLLGHSEGPADAALCSFYGGIVRDEAVRRDMGRWLTREQFREVSGEFEYRLGRGWAAFEQAFLASSAPPRESRAGAAAGTRRGPPRVE